MKIKFGKIEQLLAVTVIGIVGLFMYLKFSFNPAVKNYNRIHKKWIQISKEVDSLKKDVKNEEYWKYVLKVEKDIKDLKQELEKKQANATKTGNILLTEMKLFKTIEDNKLKVVRYEPYDKSKIKTESLLKKQRYLNIYLTGNYFNFLRFLSDINSSFKTVTIEKIVIKNKKTYGNLDINLIVGFI